MVTAFAAGSSNAGNVAASYNEGLPVGAQIVGWRFREDMILDAGEAIESRVGVMANRLFERGWTTMLRRGDEPSTGVLPRISSNLSNYWIPSI